MIQSSFSRRMFNRILMAILVTGILFTGAGTGWAAPPRNIVHTWKRLFYAELDGKESLIFLERFDRAKPALGDMDGDGDLDLFLGRGDGRVMYFENQGSRAKPRWRLVNEAISAQDRGKRAGEETLHTIDSGGNAAPALTDMDGDGDLDLLVGSASGKVTYYVNTGNRFLASFRLESPDLLGGSLGLNLVVKFPDLNRDGLPDLSAGNEAGEFFIALNQGTRREPRYCLQARPSQHCLAVLQKLGALDPEDNAVPEWVDWDRDGDLDLMVGKSDGTIAYFQNIGDASKGIWELVNPRFQIFDSGGYAAPLFADVTGDGQVDLLLAGDREAVAFYTRRPKAKLPLWLTDKNVLQVRRLGGFQTRARVATGDLDGDGDLDLILGTRGGQLLRYDNVGRGGVLALRSVPKPVLPTPQRAFAAPTLADLDGDGDLDLLVGGREGRLEWIENFGGAKNARWRIRNLFFAAVDVGAISVPLAADLDGDGDPDLLVGNSLGNVVFFENVGGAKRADFVLRTINFGGVKASSNAAPSLFAWNPKSGADLLVGNRSGALVPAVRDPARKVTEARAYLPQNPWVGIRASADSAPHFANLSGDPGPDLLVGTGTGAVLLWRYEGAKPHRPSTRRRRANIVDSGIATTEPPSGVGPGAAAPGQPATAGVSKPAAKPAIQLPLDPIFVYERSPLETLGKWRSSKPAFFDHNGDGRADLVVGTRRGALTLFVNRGPGGKPRWQKITDRFAGYRSGRNAAPAFADLDGDGDLDLAVGNERGKIAYYENTGSRDAPKFTLISGALAALRAGKNAVPAFLDLNGDQRPDLVVGNLKGQLLLYLRAKGAKLKFTLVQRRFLGLDVGVNATPVFADPTTGKRPFLLVGSDKGAVLAFAPTRTSLQRSSGWKQNLSILEGLRVPPGSRPALADIDGDGDPDLVLGSDKGPLLLYRNQARQPGQATPPPGR